MASMQVVSGSPAAAGATSGPSGAIDPMMAGFSAEAVAAAAGGGLYEFPIQVNFGWWRMFQSADAPPVIQSRFGFNRFDKSIGLRYADLPLQSIHTHWRDGTSVTGLFNRWIDAYTMRAAAASKLTKAWRAHVGFT